MSCTCNETRELDEMGQTYEGDFVEDFEAMLDELDPEADQEVAAAPRKRYGDLDFETDGEDEFDQEAEIIGPDNRKLVKNTTDAPFRYICDLDYLVPGVGYRSIGTGTLIGPRTVLTAGHCIDGVEARFMRVRPGRNGTSSPLPSATAAKFIPFPGYAPSSPTDLGIIHLAQPIGQRVGYWTRAYTKRKSDAIGTSFLAGGLPMPAGQLKVNLSGYPADMPAGAKYGCRDAAQPEYRCHHSLLSNKKRSPVCGTYQYRAYDLTVRRSGRILHYLDDTCPGHSGCPVWVRRDPTKGGRVLIGVHTSSDDPATRGKANRGVLFDKTVLAWIAKYTR
jgi:V8-like Glu-specific endopeptidase